MALDNKPLEAVDLAELQRLITDGVAEQQGIDYKKAFYIGADPQKDKFLFASIDTSYTMCCLF